MPVVDSIAKSLGAGSGIDITALVSSLVEAQFEPKTRQFTKREETLSAQISTVAQLKSAMTGFSTALASLTKGGTLTTQPTSANTGIVKASALAGAKLAGLNTSVEVRGLASSQVAATNTAVAAGTNIGTGSLTLKLGSVDGGGAFQWDNVAIDPIVIGSGDATLGGIAARINAAAAGITASVITDGGGERLVLKGASGAAKAFTLTASETVGDEGLAAINVGAGAAGTTIAVQAADARLAIDGVEVRRASNSISDLIPGVRLDLQTAAIGTRVSIGSTPATEGLRQAVTDVVATYNELQAILKTATDPLTGPLARDTAALDMARALRKITLTDLTGATNGSPRTLAEIGVATNRDGTLSIDANRLTTSLARNPAAIEAMFADGAGSSGAGLSAALASITLSVTSSITGLGAAASRYAKAQAALTGDKTKATDAREILRTRLTQQYSTMESRVAAYRTTQAFLTQQVDAWNAR